MGALIAKISRGYRVGGLLRYLLGPGRFNEHTDAHLVAAWDGEPVSHQPPRAGPEVAARDRVGEFAGADVAALGWQVAAAAVAAGIPQSRPAATETAPGRGTVWHCSLRNDKSDRVLSDAEWEQVVVDVLHRTGIARRGELGACRWVAVRHAPDHVHIAAVLVRQDTLRRVHPWQDYRAARDACQAAEVRYGLVRTGTIDRTAASAPGRAELGKASRLGREEGDTSRERLRRAVRTAAVQAQDEEAFFARLSDQGVLVRPRYDSGRDGGRDGGGAVVGYAVATFDDVTAAGAPVWFGGSSLSRDLSLPALRARWASATAAVPIPPGPREWSRVGRAERSAALAAATAAAREATSVLHGADLHEHDADELDGVDEHGVDEHGVDEHGVERGGRHAGVVHAAGELLTAVELATRHNIDTGIDMGQVRGGVAEMVDRSARQAGVGQPRDWSSTASLVRAAAWRLAGIRVPGGRRAGGGDAGEVVALVLACVALVAEIAAYHQARGRLVQAAAAARGAALLAQHPVLHPPAAGVGGVSTVSARRPASAAPDPAVPGRRRPGARSTSPTPPAPPPPTPPPTPMPPPVSVPRPGAVGHPSPGTGPRHGRGR